MTDELLSGNAVVPKRGDTVCFIDMSCVEDQCKEFQDNIQFMHFTSNCYLMYSYKNMI